MNFEAKGFGREARLVRNITAIILVALSLMTSCNKDDDNPQYDQVKPKGPKPAWGPTITAQMQTVIETLDTIAPTPIELLSPAEARQQPGAADAYLRVMQNFHITMPSMTVDTSGQDIPVNGGSIHLRFYVPRTGKQSYPVIVYYHGGGWVIATVDTYNSSAQALAQKAEAIVVAVEYRKGPEFKFPMAHNDSYAAYKWVTQNATTFKGDSSKIATAGESAGGNLAVAVAIMARDSGIHIPQHILSVYPVANGDPGTDSKVQYAAAKPLNTPMLAWFLGHYLNDISEAANPLISLINADLSSLPPVTIINAEIDPLQTEGSQLEQKLKEAGVPVERRLYNGVTHEFFGMDQVVPEAKTAQDYAADRLKNALD